MDIIIVTSLYRYEPKYLADSKISLNQVMETMNPFKMSIIMQKDHLITCVFGPIADCF